MLAVDGGGRRRIAVLILDRLEHERRRLPGLQQRSQFAVLLEEQSAFRAQQRAALAGVMPVFGGWAGGGKKMKIELNKQQVEKERVILTRCKAVMASVAAHVPRIRIIRIVLFLAR